nr:O-antigen ligase family protein [Chloroflexota bacterium]
IMSMRTPLIAAGIVLGTCVLAYVLLCAERVQQHWLIGLSALLFGYMLFSRSFAYLGVAPLYVGDLMLAFGLLALLLGGGLGLVLRSPVVWLLIGLLLLGVLRTAPYLPIYQMDALRDGVTWGYGLFALITAACLLRTGWIERVVEQYSRWMPWFLIWAPISFMLIRLAGSAIPILPGSNVPLLYLKPGDTAVHLAGTAAFMFLGLQTHRSDQRSHMPHEWTWWAAWLIGALLMTSANRGGMLAIAVAALLVSVLWPRGKWWKAAVLSLIVASLLFVSSVFFAFDPEIQLSKTYTISPSQVLLNFQSVFEDTGQSTLENTRQWRLDWWNTIIDYTFHGEYFWTGKGFGINLADDDGFQVKADSSLRSPHNGHLTFLARAGVPGFALWIVLQSTFAISLLVAYLRARRMQHDQWAKTIVWILAYWMAFMVNASFDVTLEGPQQGIWFWSLFGFGIAVLLSYRSKATALQHNRRTFS